MPTLPFMTAHSPNRMSFAGELTTLFILLSYAEFCDDSNFAVLKVFRN